MMYSPDIEQKCALCRYSKKIDGVDRELVCEKFGVVASSYVCKKFKYDIFKKKVKRRKPIDTNYSPDDFSID